MHNITGPHGQNRRFVNTKRLQEKKNGEHLQRRPRKKRLFDKVCGNVIFNSVRLQRQFLPICSDRDLLLEEQRQ